MRALGLLASLNCNSGWTFALPMTGFEAKFAFISRFALSGTSSSVITVVVVLCYGSVFAVLHVGLRIIA